MTVVCVGLALDLQAAAGQYLGILTNTIPGHGGVKQFYVAYGFRGTDIDTRHPEAV